jgi:DNA invertase Pin-like site-specific DNA recombinase
MADKRRAMGWVDGYVRVSKVGMRRGERFISPTAQREAIKAWASRTGHRVGAIFEELDESGATFDRPLLHEAITRVEQGISNGIVVDRVDRFGRSELRGLLAIHRIHAAGGTVYAVQEALDSGTDAGRLMLRNMLSTAEWELDRRRQTWDTARRLAIARGVHHGPRPPFGYRKTRAGRLRPHSVTGPIVTELYRRRADGEPISGLCRWLEQLGVRTNVGNPGWSYTTTRNLLRNPVYLGQVRSGRYRRERAHTPLTDPATWEQAQGPLQGLSPTQRRPSLLAGIARCASCGRVMGAGHRSDAKRITTYRCAINHPAGRCPAPAYIDATYLEPVVEGAVMRLLSQRRRRPVAQLGAAEQRANDAEKALWRYRDSDRILRLLGEEAYAAGLTARKERLRDARLHLAAARSRDAMHEIPPIDEVAAAWGGMDTVARRALIRRVIDCVFVAPGRMRPEERITVFSAGTAPTDLPTRGDKHSRMRPLRADERPADDPGLTAWDPAVLRRRLLQFTRTYTRWPTHADFRRRGRNALFRQLIFQGGERFWANELGLPYRSINQLSGPWTEDRIHATLRVFLDGKQSWPSTTEFRVAGLYQLHGAIGRTGGTDRWAQAFGLPYVHYPKGHWTADRIRMALKDFCEGRDYFPTCEEFRAANLGGLHSAMTQAHATQRWAEEFELPRRPGGRHRQAR